MSTEMPRLHTPADKSPPDMYSDEKDCLLEQGRGQSPPPPKVDPKILIYKGLFSFFGLQLSYLTWGMMQELIMTTQFNPTASSPDGMFPSASFCVFSNRFLAIIISFIVIKRVHGTIYCSAPYYAFLPCAISNTTSSWAQYASLHYVSFPMQNIFKSTKVIPVMLMGMLLRGVSYSRIEYVEATAITSGVLLFSMSKNATHDNNDETSVIGILLLLTYVCSDSFTSQWQSRIYKDYGKIDQYHMMFWVNTWAVMLTLGALIFSGEIFTVTEFLLVNPTALLYNIVTAITSATGQFFIFYTIKEFGPIVFTVIMTTRQMLSMVLSSVFFGHKMSIYSYLGATLVFGAVFYSVRRQMNKHGNPFLEVVAITFDSMLEFEEELLENINPNIIIPSLLPIQISTARSEAILHNVLPSIDLYFWVKLCVFIDFLGVALVIPLLSSYLRDAGVGPEAYGLMTSVYSLSQIVGSVVICLLLDTVSRRNMLILSFTGSAISYAIVGFSSQLWLLFLSRVVVGLVKQTYTISTSILSSTCDDNARRAELMGHLSAATTLAFIIGPTIGSILYSVDPRLPAAFSSTFFVLNIVICFFTIPSITPQESITSPPSPSSTPGGSLGSIGVFGQLKGAIPPVIAIILTAFLDRSMSNANIMAYFELRYNLHTAHLGYVSSVTSLVALFAQVYMIKPVIATCGGNERKAMVCACVACAIANFLEGRCVNIYQYLLLVVPISVAGTSVMHTLSRSVLSSTVPTEHMGKALSALGLFESGVGVLAPLYGTELFSRTGYSVRGLVAGVHYVVAAGLVWALLVGAQVFVGVNECNVAQIAGKEERQIAVTIGGGAKSNSGTAVATRRRRAKRAD